MIQAKITNLDPVQVTGYKLRSPRLYRFSNTDNYWIAYNKYLASKFIADVENVHQGVITKRWYAEIRIYFEEDNLSYLEPKMIKLNQSCFIEETSEGKCKIVKL